MVTVPVGGCVGQHSAKSAYNAGENRPNHKRHGGVISGLMDMAAGVAAKSLFGEGARGVATVSLTINYQRPAQVGRTLTDVR